MLRKVKLYGRLAQQYTPEIELGADDLRTVVAGLNSNYPGFRDDFIDGEWHVLRGDLADDDSMQPDEVGLQFGEKDTVIHIYPKMEGAGGGRGLWGIVLGVALIAVAWWAAPAAAGALGGMGAEAFAVAGMSISYGQIAMFGLSMAMSGIAQMMAPAPQVGDMMAAERAEDRPSFMFNGPVNVMVAGGPVPLVYGLFEVGSTVVSAGIAVEKIPV